MSIFFKILVRIASYGLQIDQSHGENRLSHKMTNCFCCASNVFKQPDYYNNLYTAVKFTLKLRKELKILRYLSCTCFVFRGSNIYFHYLESLDKLVI